MGSRKLYVLMGLIVFAPLGLFAAGDHGSDSASATVLTVNAADINGEIEIQGDRDWFAFAAVAGTSYSIKVTGNSISATHVNLYDTDGTTNITNQINHLLWNAANSGIYYVEVWGFNNQATGTYSIGIQSYQDDHWNTIDGATNLTVGDPASNGSIEVPGDLDFFQFDANEGVSYSIQTQSANMSYLRVRLSKESYIIQGTCGTTWTVPAGAGGVHYVQIDSNQQTGNYQVQVNTFTDDHGNNAETATPVTVGAPAIGGELEVNGEQDWFRFSAQADVQYQISATPTAPGTPGVPQYAQVLIYDANGMLLGSSLNGLVWRSPASTEYYVEVVYNACQSNNAATTYDFSVVQRAVDDHGDTAGSATRITVDSTTDGILDVPGDTDWFVFSPQAGQSYAILVESEAFTDRSVELYDSDTTTEISNNKNGLSWTCSAPCTGDRYIKVYSASAQTGAYRILLEGFTDDHGNIPSEATSVVVDAAPTQGSIDKPADLDWFSFDAVAGETYEIRADGNSLTSLFLTLHGTNGISTLLRDTSGFSANRSIIWQCEQTGNYYFQVFNLFDNSETGSYTVQVNTYVPPTNPPPQTGNQNTKKGSMGSILLILCLLFFSGRAHQNLLTATAWYKLIFNKGQ